MISHKHKCIFIHIPKSAGSSITEIFWPKKKDRTTDNLWMGQIDEYSNKYQTGGLQHLLGSQVKQEIGPEIFDQYFKFSVIRNPWDKAASQYSYMQRRPDLRRYIGMNKNDSFKTYLELIQQRKHVQWEEQYNFVCDDQGKLIINSLGRFENLHDYLRQLLVDFKLDKKWFFFKRQIPHINKGSSRNYREIYDDASEETVAQMYKKDIELFQYTF